MSGSHSVVDRPIPSVAIVGTDAVLAAAPATPVQLAHACLRRGFTVAVPASWGDELVASETLRRLKTRERGPAVMCVCPFARARLLGPGPDLAPFLVSLVSPPVAVARYLRSAYGDQRIHVTYIGSCPGADGPDIDTRLTPDAFVAELAEHGVSLSEQPLVFDSIVPPDRRRWCSLPGGVPNADTLWTETDGRTIVEVESNDATTELAQHILAREHVLLDLAPGLGCACSGAFGGIAPDRARATVAATEPPRALSAVIDSATIVSLDAPVTPTKSATLLDTQHPRLAAAGGSTGDETALERVLDELLGTGAAAERGAGAPESPTNGSAIIVDLPELPPLGERAVATVAVELPGADPVSHVSTTVEALESDIVIQPVIVAVMSPEAAAIPDAASDENEMPVIVEASPSPIEPSGHATTLGTESTTPAELITAAETMALPPSDQPVPETSPQTGADDRPEPRDLSDPYPAPLRRRTPPAMLRYAGSAIPKATVASGKPLPRAYVAKRRTPPAGAAAITAPSADSHPSIDSALVTKDSGASSSLPASGPVVPQRVVEPLAPHSVRDPSTQSAAGAATVSAVASESVAIASVPASGAGATGAPEAAPRAAVNNGGASASARPASHPALLFLLVTALVALAVFVLLTLQR